MKSAFLVVAINGDLVNKFALDSMLQAVNIKDYLEGVGDYQEISIYQLAIGYGSDERWVPVEPSRSEASPKPPGGSGSTS